MHKTFRSVLVISSINQVTAKILFGKSASAPLKLLLSAKWGCIVFLRLHRNHAHHGQRGKVCGSIGFLSVEPLETIDWRAKALNRLD